MYYSDTDTPIPKYALEPDRATGNKLLRVKKVDGKMNTTPWEFLVPHRKDYYFMVLVKKGGSRHWIDMMP
ncbi:MAG TPA: hypothetical protein VFE54_11810, partial [Mucilaginibacter sp.]|nr:hypothetical protein [Mucilaginibacter sp.]